MLTVKTLALRKRQLHIIKIEVVSLQVLWLQIALKKICNESRPALLRIAHAYTVSVIRRLLRQQRHVRSSQDDGHPLSPKIRRQLISPWRGTGYHGHAYQIGVKICRDFADTLVNQSYVNWQCVGHQCCQGCQSERLIAQGALENPTPTAIQRPFRGDQYQLHFSLLAVREIIHIFLHSCLKGATPLLGGENRGNLDIPQPLSLPLTPAQIAIGGIINKLTT